MTPKQLANVLRELSNNKEKYEEYLAYKKAPLSQEFVNIAYQSYVHPLVGCRVCDYYQQKIQKQKNSRSLVIENNNTIRENINK